ncbi:uncharacterized protein J4E84_010133 [Alternaria hordeiaustralica]|uniref:uncharacterized protein n=1 Tax=Alternaria hordeiaustralica TaxID=1187925 RepID=UPI0020C26DE1|nr:uncharacterized protein J4E84_010133 [Alternaria hordeiaustralica]KAI4675391.1 hypothetical protein J4E84_010133 [Alternaria hordeiaustralica]
MAASDATRSPITSIPDPTTGQWADASSEAPLSATSTPPSSTNQGETTPVGPAPLPNDTGLAHATSKGQNDVTVHSHVTITATSNAAPQSTATTAAAPTLSTTAIAGTAAGGTVGIALIIGLIFLFMRRRKRQSSLASPADIWEPSRNTSPKPKLPNIQHDSSFGRYSEMGAGVLVRQRSKAELHSEDMPVPRPQTGYFRPPEMHGGGGENARYYNSGQPSEPHGHGGNMDSRYPELSSHAVMSMSSPTSPISQASTMQGWHANSPSGAPTIRLSSADLRSEGMRSPVSELGTHAPLRSTRSAELHGAGTMSPMSELGTDSFHGVGHGAAELHNEPLLPPQIDSRSKGDVPDGVVEIDDSDMHRGHRPGVSTNF